MEGAREVSVKLDPWIPDLAALGAASPEDLLGTGEGLWGEGRAERLEDREGVVSLRLPLPGTGGGRPRGAGTGWIVVRRYDGAPGWFRARFTSPRSASHAAREWNLLCALRAAGLITAAPLALVQEEGGVFARRSALVLRDLEGVQPLEDWLEGASGSRRAALLRSLGHLLARLGAGGFELPLGPGRVGVIEGDGTRAETARDACGLERVLAARKGGGTPELGLAWRRLPELVLLDPREARMRSGSTLARLLRSLAGDGRLTRREKLRVLHAAAGNAARDLARRTRGTPLS